MNSLGCKEPRSPLNSCSFSTKSVLAKNSPILCIRGLISPQGQICTVIGFPSFPSFLLPSLSSSFSSSLPSSSTKKSTGSIRNASSLLSSFSTQESRKHSGRRANTVYPILVFIVTFDRLICIPFVSDISGLLSVPRYVGPYIAVL